MAIVRTTPKETGNGAGGNAQSGETGSTPVVTKPVDRTKSVVNPGGVSTQRAPRLPGASLKQGQTSAPSAPKDFVNDTLAELRRVVWPTKEERGAGTIVTILLLVFFAIYILGLDSAARYLFIALQILPADTPK